MKLTCLIKIFEFDIIDKKSVFPIRIDLNQCDIFVLIDQELHLEITILAV